MSQLEDNTQICKQETTEDSKKKGKVINFVVHCNGSNIGNGMGIGNGNMNGGGGGCGCAGGQTGMTGQTGQTGITGTTGQTGMVCDAGCNAVCEQIYLEQTANPSSVSRLGQVITWTFKATNVSGTMIPGPIVISSSLLGTIFLTDRGFGAGETITVSTKLTLNQQNAQSPSLSSVAYAATGVPTGIPDRFTPGTRLSPVVVTAVFVNLPSADLIGNIEVTTTPNGENIKLTLTVKNTGSLDITSFIADLSPIFIKGCNPTIGLVGSPFRIGDNKQLILTTSLTVGGSASVVVTANNCPACQECCIGDFSSSSCPVDYRYHAEQGPDVTQSIRVPIVYVF